MTEGTEPFLAVEGVTKHWGSFTALDTVSVAAYPGEFVSVLGPSGCGKTTLLRIIAGLETANSGRIHLRGRDITALPPAKRECGIVFQSYALFPNLTVEQNVAYGLRRRGANKFELAGRVKEMLDLVGLAHMMPKYPAQLSGGEQQRVALARALATQPSLLLLDEPLSALDARVRIRLRHEIRALQQRLGVTTLMVTHDQEEALTMADRVVVLSAGKLVQVDSPVDLYHQPADTFVADFIGSMNFVPDCETVESGRVRMGEAGLAAPRGGSLPAGTKVTLAIRPEDVRVGGDADSSHGNNTVRARVEDIEFRGAFYRVRLLLRDGGPAADWKTLEADVQPMHAENMGLRTEQTVLAHLPADRLIIFDPATGKMATRAAATA
jgi:iron(III) transport system ATP-binding protein